MAKLAHLRFSLMLTGLFSMAVRDTITGDFALPLRCDPAAAFGGRRRAIGPQMSKQFDTGNPAPRAHWPRQSQRESIQADVSSRRAGALVCQVQLFDVSPHGCKVEFLEQPNVDERVWVKFEGLESLSGLVCWVGGFVAGVEFDKTIHSAVFERLVTQLR